MKRTPNDDCLLCITNKATKTNNHLIPAGLLKLSIGKRGYESFHSIDTKEGRVRKHYGRNNSPIQKIKPLPLAPDYYLCPQCEEEIGFIEAKVTPFVTVKLRDPNQKGNYKQISDRGGIIGKEITKLDGNNFNVFFLSIIWRFGIYYHLERRESPLTINELELIRRILYCYIYKDQECYDKWCDQFGLIVLSPEQFSKPIENLGFTVEYINRPSFFYLFEFLVLIYSSADMEEAKLSGNPNFYKLRPDFDLMNFCGSTSKVGILPIPFWESMNKLLRHNAKGVTYRYKFRNSDLTSQIRCSKKKKMIVRTMKKKRRKTSDRNTHPSILMFTSAWN